MSLLMERLPEAIFDMLLSEWNEVKELTKFDSASCNSHFRPSLISAYERKTFFLNDLVGQKAQAWCFNKCIKPKGLLSFHGGSFWCPSNSPVTENILQNNDHIFLEVTGLGVSLGYRRSRSDVLDDEHLYIFKVIRFVNSCPKLRAMDFKLLHSFSYVDLFQLMDQSILRRMTTFVIVGNRQLGISMDAINHISFTCASLIVLKLEVSDWAEDIILRLLFKHSHCLTTVSFRECHLSDALLEGIVHNLSQIVVNITLIASQRNYLCAKFVNELLSECKCIENLHVGSRYTPVNFEQYIKVLHFQCENFRSLFIKNASEVQSDIHVKILAKCTKIRWVSLCHMSLSPLFLQTMLTQNKHSLNFINLAYCTMDHLSCCLLRDVFVACTSLNTIKIENCSLDLLVSDGFVSLLSELPSHVTTLLIGGHARLDLADVQSIVFSNPHLQKLWYAEECHLETNKCDKSKTKAFIQQCGGPHLEIIEDLAESCVFDLELY